MTVIDSLDDAANTDVIAASDLHRVHFVGIGGAGMSGIALVLHERGCQVSGSDLKRSHYVRELESAGIKVYVGHNASTIDTVDPEIIVVSSAIPDSNPEVVRAKERGVRIWPRAKMLSALCEGATTVAVAGTHGKTTTSSMVATMLDHLGLDPAFLIGGIVEEYGTNGRDGRGGYFVCEADESDGSFLFLRPDVAIVTNIEADHLDHYGSLANVEKAFVTFMGLVGSAGTIIVNGDNQHYVDLATSTGRKVVTYGMQPGNDFTCIPNPSDNQFESRCTVIGPQNEEAQVSLSASPGIHNLVNATAALAVAHVLGANQSDAAQALSSFGGAHRRFTRVGEASGITVVDDYGHHPTEIKATLKAATALGYKRVIVVFQPHRYSRTAALLDSFATAFDDADAVIVMDVFSAGELPIPGVGGKTVASALRDKSSVNSVDYVPTHREVIQHLMNICHQGDLVITQGAGDVTTIGPAFLEALREAGDA